MKKHKRALVWLRRDLRLEDQVALAHASQEAEEVALAFVFDTQIIGKLKDKDDRRISFIFDSLSELNEELEKKGSSLILLHGDPTKEIPALAKALNVNLVCTNKDYEPYAKNRDESVAKSLLKLDIDFKSFKDHVIFEGLEVKNGSGAFFKVFTPYKNAWLKQLKNSDYESRDLAKTTFLDAKIAKKHSKPHTIETFGFQHNPCIIPAGSKSAKKLFKKFEDKISEYKKNRDFPSIDGTSYLSMHLRFGTLSIRECVRKAHAIKGVGAETWLSELIWRDFYHMILDQNPHVVDHAFKPEYDSLKWPGKESHFKAWCEGKTGYPIIDAAMRYFNETGWMHNRLRMVVASFLVKDLLIDWKKGEEYFARYLLDFDLAANNGGWQWCASTGCDAQPYFRIFNPHSQSERFDPKGEFIKAHIPELKSYKGDIHKPETGGLFGAKYPEPIVDHSEQRDRALALYKIK